MKGRFGWELLLSFVTASLAAAAAWWLSPYTLLVLILLVLAVVVWAMRFGYWDYVTYQFLREFNLLVKNE
jgi:hypothetical protein